MFYVLGKSRFEKSPCKQHEYKSFYSEGAYFCSHIFYAYTFDHDLAGTILDTTCAATGIDSMANTIPER